MLQRCDIVDITDLRHAAEALDRYLSNIEEGIPIMAEAEEAVN